MIITGYVLSVPFIIIAQYSGVALAFHTKNCDHSLLEVKAIDTITCLSNINKQLVEVISENTNYVNKPSEFSNTVENSPLDCAFVDRNVHVG